MVYFAFHTLRHAGPEDAKKLYSNRYEYWIYRQINKQILHHAELNLEEHVGIAHSGSRAAKCKVFG